MVGSSVAKEKNRSLDIYTLIINLEMFFSFTAEGKIKESNYLQKEENKNKIVAFSLNDQKIELLV